MPEPIRVEYLEESRPMRVDHSDCRIMLGENSRMDIPEDMRLTSQYRASLAHKVQHSFHPNCEFWEVSSDQ